MSEIKVNLFCDEIKNRKLQTNIGKSQKWSYMGILIVPKVYEKELLEILLKKRCMNEENDIDKWPGNEPCSLDCGYHHKNVKEIHYDDLSTVDIYKIAKRWLDFMLNEDDRLIYFYILGINLNRLDQSFFGKQNPHDREFRIYNRFFRSAVKKPLKSYFSDYDRIIINDIFHDNSSALENHDYFPWHSLFKLNTNDNKIDVQSNEIQFLDSDHRKSLNRYSQFLQFIDLILGATYNALHYSSKQVNKVKIAEQIKDLICRLINKPGNKNSRFNYFRRMEVDFFPKNDLRDLDSEDLYYKKLKEESMYKKRYLLIKDKKYKGYNLFNQDKEHK